MEGSGETHRPCEAPPSAQGPPPLREANGSKDGPTLVTVAGAVASGLGVLGFVTFAGGVVLWSRFKQMGLSADHALGIVPKSELVATGADFLVPAVLLSAGLVLIAVLMSSLPTELANKLSPGETPPAWGSGKPKDRLRESRGAIAPPILALGGLAFSILTFVGGVPVGAFVVLVGVVVLGALIVRACAGLALPAFCLVAFLAIGTFAIARTYERTSHRLEVLPMAYARSQAGEAPRVEVGYFVAETSDRIVFASLPESKKTSTGPSNVSESPNELREFPRSETDDLEIGALARPGQAERDAAHFAYNLCERLAHLKPSSPHAGASPVCPGSYVQELAEKAALPWPPAVKNEGYVEPTSRPR